MLTKQNYCKGVLTINFYDTNALLNLGEEAFQENFFISDETLKEIENIKVSSKKDEEIKYKARVVTRLLDSQLDKYQVVNFTEAMENDLFIKGLDCSSPDNRITSCAYHVCRGEPPVEFVSDDLSCKNIARNIFHLSVSGIKITEDDYTGFKEVCMSDVEMAYFYEHPNENIYDLLLNQYLIIKNSSGQIVDTCRWTVDNIQPLINKNIKSLYFENLKPKDVYQSCVIDSILMSTITAISGKAGSGKSLLSLMTAMYLIEKGEYDRLVILFNPTITRGSNSLGYYKGDFIDKAMQSSIGQILTTKFGDRFAVDVLLQKDKLKLVSMADARGMEIKDNEILWITECQNTSVDLIKLCLSRVSNNAKVIIEGDYKSQTDSYCYEGRNNGLKRVIEAFKGHEEFGYIELQNVWRSKIAELCELL